MEKPIFVTFTGVDRKTDIGRCRYLSSRYPIEWGFLCSHSNEDERYSGLAKLSLFSPEQMSCSLHLCGQAARTVLQREAFPFLPPHFSRVQINARDQEYRPEVMAKLSRETDIIQQTRNTEEWIESPAYLLLDRSGGEGEPISDWPEEAPLEMVGYAGGLGPNRVVPLLQRLPSHRFGFWIDMESGVRTDGFLDLNKCEAVCQEIWG